MSDRIRIADLREAANQGDYFLDAAAMSALLDAVEAARRVARERTGHELGGEHPLYVKLCTLDETLARFDFGDER